MLIRPPGIVLSIKLMGDLVSCGSVCRLSLEYPRRPFWWLHCVPCFNLSPHQSLLCLCAIATWGYGSQGCGGHINTRAPYPSHQEHSQIACLSTKESPAPLLCHLFWTGRVCPQSFSLSAGICSGPALFWPRCQNSRGLKRSETRPASVTQTRTMRHPHTTMRISAHTMQ